MQIQIDEEFKNLIPPLQADEYKQLEQNIINDGCRDPLVIWNDTIIDGHNRFKICTDNSIEFKTENMEFDSREDVKLWMIFNQIGKRNLTAFVKSELALMAEPIISAIAKTKMLLGKSDPTQMSAEGSESSIASSAAKNIVDESSLFPAHKGKEKKAINMIANRKVYIMKDGEELKIGHSSKPLNRLETFRTARPNIKLLFEISGTVELEKKAHKKFDMFSNGGEWFRYSEDILADMIRYLKKSSGEENTTRSVIAKSAGVSRDTISKVKKIKEKVSDDTIQQLRKGEISVNQAFKEAKSIELAEKKEERREEKREARLNLQVEEPEYDELIKLYTPRLMHGDTLKEITKIGSESIDLVVTDPPYNMDKADWDSYGSAEEFADWMELWLEECFRVLKPTGSIYVFGLNRMLSHVQMRMEKIGFKYRNWIIWDTVQGAGGGLWVNRQEAILYFSKSDDVYEDKDSIKLYRSEENIREYKGKTYEFKNPSNIWRFPTVDDKAEDRTAHPTQKPVELIERIIKANSKEGDTILDCFMGSGSTGVAAMKNRRLSVGIEMNETYISISKKRFSSVEL